jgi:hypothetical protein
MAQLDFGLLNTNLPAEIAGSVQRGQDEALRSQMAQQQFKTAGLQQESAQMQLEQAKRDRDSLAKMQEAFVANGKSPDLETNFDEMIKSGIAHYVDIGIKGKQKLMEQKQFANIMGGAPAAAPMPTAAPPIAYPQTSAPTNALGSGAFSMEPVAAPMNALAPSAPAAPLNALAAPAAGLDVTELRRKRNMLLAMGTTQSIAAARAMDADIALASKEPVYHNVPGVGLVDPRSARVIVPEGVKDSEFEKLLKSSTLSETEKNRLRIQRAQKEATHAPGTSVTMVAEKAEAGAFGKMMVDQFADLSKSANLAIKTLPSIEANLNILNKGLDTGFGTETKAAGARVLSALGVKDAEKYATDTQTFQSNAIQGLMQKQLEQKGPQTESDAQRLEQIGAQLGKTKKANEFILDTAKEQLKRDIDQRNFYAKWKEKTDSFKGAEDAWFAGEGSKSLFDRPALKKYLTPTSTNAAPAASNRPSLESIFKK